MVFAVVLAFGPPLVAVGLEALGGLVSTKAAALLHVIALWFFGFTAIEQLLIRLDPAAGWTMVFPAVASYAGVIAYLRWLLVRSFLSVRLRCRLSDSSCSSPLLRSQSTTLKQRA